jgi:hypothetical protein
LKATPFANGAALTSGATFAGGAASDFPERSRRIPARPDGRDARPSTDKLISSSALKVFSPPIQTARADKNMKFNVDSNGSHSSC